MSNYSFGSQIPQLSCGALIAIAIGVLALCAGWTLLLAYPIMWAWNAIATNFHWPLITYWVSVAITFIFQLIASIFYRGVKVN